MNSREVLKAAWLSVVIGTTGFAALFGARYTVGLFLSRQQCDQRTTDYFLWTNPYWIIQAIPVSFAVASILLALNWKKNGLATNASRLTFLLASLLCINQLATLNLTFSDGVFFTSCFWGDWKELEETEFFAVLSPVVPIFVVALTITAVVATLWKGLRTAD